jgi:nitroreductase
MDLFTAIDTRASAAKLAEPAPTREHLERIIDAGARAPDHGKLAPWRFVVLGNAARQQVGNIMAQVLLAKDASADAEQLQRERNKITGSPCIVAVAARITNPQKIPECEQEHATAAAVQNMFLAAHALGYGAMWKTGGAASSPQVKQLLGLNETDQIVALLHLGTASMPGTPRGAVHKESVRWLD